MKIKTFSDKAFQTMWRFIVQKSFPGFVGENDQEIYNTFSKNKKG